MAFYEALPIYRYAMDVAARVDRVIQRFAKRHKYTLGACLREATIDIVVLIAPCNRRADRVSELPVLCREVHAAAYQDRAVHHLTHALVEPLFERVQRGLVCVSQGQGNPRGGGRSARAHDRPVALGGLRAWALRWK